MEQAVFFLILGDLAVGIIAAFSVVTFFQDSIRKLLLQIVLLEEMAEIWSRYIKFACYVFAISGGSNLYRLESYLNQSNEFQIEMNIHTLGFNLYSALIGSIKSLALLLFFVFLFTLIAYVITKARGSSRKD